MKKQMLIARNAHGTFKAPSEAHVQYVLGFQNRKSELIGEWILKAYEGTEYEGNRAHFERYTDRTLAIMACAIDIGRIDRGMAEDARSIERAKLAEEPKHTADRSRNGIRAGVTVMTLAPSGDVKQVATYLAKPGIDARTDELAPHELAAVAALVNHIASTSGTKRSALLTSIKRLVDMRPIRGGSGNDEPVHYASPWECGHNDPIYVSHELQECAICHETRRVNADGDVPLTHPDGTAMYAEDITRALDANAARRKHAEKRARYLAQYPEAKRSWGGLVNPLCGVDELRSAVQWADGEPESRHDWQTAEDVLNAYRNEGKA